MRELSNHWRESDGSRVQRTFSPVHFLSSLIWTPTFILTTRFTVRLGRSLTHPTNVGFCAYSRTVTLLLPSPLPGGDFSSRFKFFLLDGMAKKRVRLLYTLWKSIQAWNSCGIVYTSRHTSHHRSAMNSRTCVKTFTHTASHKVSAPLLPLPCQARLLLMLMQVFGQMKNVAVDSSCLWI